MRFPQHVEFRYLGRSTVNRMYGDTWHIYRGMRGWHFAHADEEVDAGINHEEKKRWGDIDAEYRNTKYIEPSDKKRNH